MRVRTMICAASLAAGAIVPGVILASSSASATPTNVSTPSAGYPACTVSLTPVTPGTGQQSVMGPEHCYATAAARTQAMTPLTTFVIGIDYMDTNYSGASLSWTGGAACSSSQSYYANSMPSGWNNDVSSAASNYSNCTNYVHWDGTKQTGANIDCTNNLCYYIGGAMNDRTSSEDWYS